MSKGEFRIQAYVDSELGQLLQQYADSNQLSLSKAVAILLKNALDNQSVQLSQDSDFITRSEFDEFKKLVLSRFEEVDDNALSSYTQLEAMISTSPAVSVVYRNSPKSSKSRGFG